MKIEIIKWIVPLLALLIVACTSEEMPGTETESVTPRSVASQAPGEPARAGYVFDQPDVSFALPGEIKEISGLTVLPNGHLGAVQDEEGILFELNRETGAIEARYPFGDTGDYEGIELVGESIFVLLSNGNLMELDGWSGGDPQIRTHKTGLKGKNDTEGLGYDEANGRLLIACKEDPGNDLDKDQKAIYAFDVKSGSLGSEPAYVLDLNELEGQLSGSDKFKPSALAVHPTSGAIYVLSSVAKALVVLSEEGHLEHVWPLSERLFEQPEGLAFLPDGTLYISSEGVDGPGMVYRFSYNEAAR